MKECETTTFHVDCPHYLMIYGSQVSEKGGPQEG